MRTFTRAPSVGHSEAEEVAISVRCRRSSKKYSRRMPEAYLRFHCVTFKSEEARDAFHSLVVHVLRRKNNLDDRDVRSQ